MCPAVLLRVMVMVLGVAVVIVMLFRRGCFMRAEEITQVEWNRDRNRSSNQRKDSERSKEVDHRRGRLERGRKNRVRAVESSRAIENEESLFTYTDEIGCVKFWKSP